MNTLRFGPSKGQVRYAVSTEGIPSVLARSMPSIGLTVGEGIAVVAARLDVYRDDEAKIASIPGVLKLGDSWYFAATGPIGGTLIPCRTAKEWDDADDIADRGEFFPEPAGRTTQWPSNSSIPVMTIDWSNHAG